MVVLTGTNCTAERRPAAAHRTVPAIVLPDAPAPRLDPTSGTILAVATKTTDDLPAMPPLDRTGGFEMQPIGGRTIDFEYDGLAAGSLALAYSGRVFVPDAVLAGHKPVPLLVFFHGTNKDLVRHRWMGGGPEGDVRRMVAAMIEHGEVPPMIVAGPSSVQPEAVTGFTSFPVFDFDNFMRLTVSSLSGVAEIDMQRVIVAGHSGASCSERGGVLSATHSAFVPYAVMTIDGCLNENLAARLLAAPSSIRDVITWRSSVDPHKVDVFERAFARRGDRPRDGFDVLAELPTPSHDATLPLSLKRYLPALLR